MAKKPDKPAPKKSAKPISAKANTPSARAGKSAKPTGAATTKAPQQIEAKPLPRLPTLGLDAIIGQDEAIATLRRAMASGRLHHAWVFEGTAGVGKFTTALAFARLALRPAEGDADEADLHVITKELASVSRDAKVRDGKQRNIAKAVLDEFLIEPATRTRVGRPGSMATRAFLIDEAELIEDAGQNSLLKTLEEPPVGSLIVLVTSRPDRLLATIRSRCQRVAFTPLDPPSMGRWLQTLDLSGLDAAARDWLLTFSGGSPGMAALALSSGLTQWHATLTPMLAEADHGRFPLSFGASAVKLLSGWSEAWVEANPSASKDAANKAAARLLFRMLHEHYRARARRAPQASARAIERVARAERFAEAGVQPIFVLDDLAAGLASIGASAASEG
ncbi:MAG: hypothetical protein JNM80_05730 [Phycisphaerae bacterium]|nr:hypothetical protein [Phycisphaerae bacterium]